MILVGGRFTRGDRFYSTLLIVAGVAGLTYLFAQGFAIGIRGWNAPWLGNLFGELSDRQFGFGYGAMLLSCTFLFYLTTGIAARGFINGDVFVVGAIGFVIAIVTVFIFFPISQMLASALQDNDGVYSLTVFVEKFSENKIWGLACLTENRGCGVAWNSLFLAVIVGAATTLLGLVFALVATPAPGLNTATGCGHSRYCQSSRHRLLSALRLFCCLGFQVA